ncbi:MAG: MFS transporter [Cyanobacteria bacterium P01_H01_bin.15]
MLKTSTVSASPPKIAASERQNLLRLFATGLLFWLSITSLLAVLPLYAQSVGNSDRLVGLVMSSFAIGLILSRMWMGQLADRRSRKLVIVIGAIVMGTAPFGYLFSDQVWELMVWRAYHGVSIASFTLGYSALVSDIAPPSRRGEILGYMALVTPLGMALGPALGSWLLSAASFSWVFMSSGIVGLLAIVLALTISDPGRPKPQNSEEETTRSQPSWWDLATGRALLSPAFVLLLIGSLFGALVAFLPLFVQEAELNVNAGLFYAAAALSSCLVRLLTGKASDRWGRGLFITGAIICYAVSYLLLAIAHSPGSLVFAGALEGIGAGIILPVTFAMVSDRSFPHERGQVLAICLFGFDLGIALGGTVLGFLIALLGYRGLFALEAGLAALSLLIFMATCNGPFQPSWRFALGRERDHYALDNN